MEVVTGAVVTGSVITKLGDLLAGEYNLQKGMKGEIRFLQSELQSMKDALEELSNTPPDQLDIHDKIWVRDLRELSYDIEDAIDRFMLCSMGSESAKPLGIKEFLDRSGSAKLRSIQELVDRRKSAKLLGVKDFVDRSARLFNKHAIKTATKIKGIDSHVQEKHRRHRRRYDVNLGVDNPFRATVDLDPRLSDRYTQTKDLVGIDETRDELIKILRGETGVPMQKYGKIVSIVGCGGLGKTTLANAVYEKIRAPFDYYAFVSVSQTPNLNKLFKGLLYDLGCKKINEEIFNQGQLVNVLREFLQDKRYCIVIDDIWDITVWDQIKCALPDNDVGYIVITTTRLFHVAEIVGGAYKLKPLSLNNSRKLLYRRIFGNEKQDNTEDIDKCPNQELAEVSDRILKKCAGVPLAITVMASLLASKARNKMEWYEVYNSITSHDKSLDVVQNMRMILSLGYYDLPSHLKCCFLYLSVFPKDYKIEKSRLIWRWIAEGFIQCEKQEKSLFELGESYFNELINRSVIQPIYNQTDLIYGCRVHDMMMDLILDLSTEENFVTILNGMDCKSPSNKIRRLSLQNAIEDHAITPTTSSLQQVRSVIVFAPAVGLMPVLRSFEVLRVLDLEDYDLSQGYNLNDLGKLFQLRYLGLRGTRIAQLPEEIKNIQFLQTLDVRHTNISRLPSTVVQLRQLMCLYTDKFTRMPNGIGRLKNLEEFSTLRIDDSTLGIIEELGLLTELRVLKVILFGKWNSKLVECLSKLQKIQILDTEANISDQHNIGRLDAWVAPRRLRILNTQWGCWFSTLPTWMNPSLLPDLCSLYIAVRELKQTDLEILGRLPALRYLKLVVDNESFGIIEKFVVGSCLFPCLVQCQLFGFIIPVMFQQGAMPRLASIKMAFPVRNMRENIDIIGSFELGLVNLPSIQDVIICFNYGGISEVDLEEVKASLIHEAEVHPNRPTLRIVVTDKRESKSHVEDMHENTIGGVVAEPVKATVFPCLFTQYMKVADLVGNEETVDELMKILTEGTEMSVTHGKIVSIVGLGGLGKTTLAHVIYRKLRAQFDCWAFVSMSQNPDMKKIFKCLLYQLGKKNNANIHEGILDERQLMYELNEFLQKRRYFIVIDDIQDILVWNMIKCALPANDGGFIIITTTCILDVAKQVGGAYMLRPLCLQNSRILLHRKTFGIEDKDQYADEELSEISEKILQKCGGVPLAIIIISGLLASKGENKIEWYKFYDSIDSVVKNILDVESMKKILSLNYGDLPPHLRTCLLYLSVFPEGHDIDKDRLIRLWIAEGLIQCRRQEENPFELGESYFYELINRSMIQPVYKRWYYDMTECCQVHDMILDLIRYLSGKEKLVSIWDHMHDTLHSKEVQWLSLQNIMVDIATHEPAVNMQEVRSVVVFPSAVKLLPALACFKVLRVLDLQSCCLSQGCSLKYLGNLFHLRYLGLRGTGIASLSEEIGKLQFLQTLDVTGNEISSLPFSVAELKHLMCLRIDSRTGAPNGFGSFTSLEELSTLRIQNSTDIIEKLSNQTELRVLGIDCRTGWNVKRMEKSLVECLHKLQKIKRLSISVVGGECNFDAWVAPQHLRRLELTGCWPSTVPALLKNPSLLLELSFLSIEVRKLRQEELENLGRLPALNYLDIEVGNQKIGIVQTFIIGACSFPCLVHCTLRGYIGPVAFQKGAMPEVARLHLVFPVREIREAAGINGGSFDVLGLRNLPRLQDISFLLRRGGAGKDEVEEAVASLWQAIESHPNRPTLEIL